MSASPPPSAPPTPPTPDDRAEAHVRAAVRAASALVRREPTDGERLAFKTSVIVYGSILGAVTLLVGLIAVSASWGPPAPPRMPRA